MRITKRTLWNATHTGIVVGLIGGVGMLSTADTTAEQSAPSVERPVAEGSPAALIAEHGCWTGEAPADMTGKFPGHVVVTPDGSDAPLVAGPAAVGQALDQIFNGKDYGLTVHAFCR